MAEVECMDPADVVLTINIAGIILILLAVWWR